ncbi:precorrin-6y C5,15-methyltransferase (decarboxylating) subunit CbiE [Rhodovibrionaceae bacterium A322]
MSQASSPWLSLVGIGEDGLNGLSPAALSLVNSAEVLVGGARHLAMVPQDEADRRERLAWPSPLSALVSEIKARKGQRVCVLATGDPLWFGVAVTLAREIPEQEMLVLPSPSAFSLACARLGWPLAQVECLTLHGRPLGLLQPALQPGNKILALSNDGQTPALAARLLCDNGYGESIITVLAHMGGTKEEMFSASAKDWPDAPCADFNTLAIDCQSDPEGALLPRSPGLPNDAFRADGQITKREVRAATLAALGPTPGALLWDVGAGCGSVAVEWMRAALNSQAIAIEHKDKRLAFLADNAQNLGAGLMKIVKGKAPEALEDLAAPDAIFIGGGLTCDGLFERCWQALKPGGRLVANVVTLDGEQRVLALQQALGGSLTKIAVSHAEPIGPFQGWRPAMTVTQWALRKPYHSSSEQDRDS